MPKTGNKQQETTEIPYMTAKLGSSKSALSNVVFVYLYTMHFSVSLTTQNVAKNNVGKSNYTI